MSDRRQPGANRRRSRVGPPSSVTLLGVALLIVAACGAPAPTASPSLTTAPTPSPSAAPTAPPSPVSTAQVDAVYGAIEGQVVEIRGLQPNHPVARMFIDEAELRTILTQEFDKETPPAYVAATERLYKALGLIPDDANLRDMTLDLLSGDVAGFYRRDQQTLYVLSKAGLPGVNERITFAHEYDHALQDQNTSVFADQEGVLDQTDRILARQAVYEGDATLLMTLWGAAHFGLSDIAEMLALGNDPKTLALLDRTPPILKEPLLFPYTTGLSFVQAAQLSGGWPSVDVLYDRMPESTEQILHPEKYAAAEHPVTVDLPEDLAAQLGTGWTVPYKDTFGELELGIWLRESGIDPATVETAADGWGGDRLAVVEGPGGAWGVVIGTAWDTAADATAFEDAAQTAVNGLTHPARIAAPSSKRVTILIAADEATLLALDVLFGATGV
jgi:hypothetical protein